MPGLSLNDDSFLILLIPKGGFSLDIIYDAKGLWIGFSKVLSRIWEYILELFIGYEFEEFTAHNTQSFTYSE